MGNLSQRHDRAYLGKPRGLVLHGERRARGGAVHGSIVELLVHAGVWASREDAWLCTADAVRLLVCFAESLLLLFLCVAGAAVTCYPNL